MFTALSNYNLSNIFLAGICLIPLSLFSQSTLRGKVTDEKTGEVVPYASVYFAGTTLGSATLEDGSFEIKNIPNGKYDLIVTVIGFKRFQQPVEFQTSHTVINVSLIQDLIVLSEIVITADQSDRKYLPLFKKYFLGQANNSKRCKILNPQDLQFYYDDKAQLLIAHASKPIIVDNRALGYRVHYTLDFFELNEKTRIKKNKGVERFEDIEPKDSKGVDKISEKRQEAYRGSFRHFIVALYNNKLKEEKFTVFSADSLGPNNQYVSSVDPLDLNQFLKGTVIKKFYYKGILKVSYEGESEEWSYKRRHNYPQVSFMIFTNDSISIFENGYSYNQLSVVLVGYLAWSEGVSEAVPSDYSSIKK